MPESNFADKTVVITGGGRGLGFGLARRFGEAGAQVVIAEIDGERGKQAAHILQGAGHAVHYEPLDVRVPAQSVALVDKLTKERGHIDVWVNNAGLAHIGP